MILAPDTHYRLRYLLTFSSFTHFRGTLNQIVRRLFLGIFFRWRSGPTKKKYLPSLLQLGCTYAAAAHEIMRIIGRWVVNRSDADDNKRVVFVQNTPPEMSRRLVAK